MKRLFLPWVMGLALCCSQTSAHTQEFKEHVSKAFTVQHAAQGILAIYNINGSIKVQGYSGDKIVFEIDKTIFAKNDSILAVGKKEFKLELEQIGDSIVAYILDPFDSRPNGNNHWSLSERKEIKYRFNLDFVVKVPSRMSLDISTVNKGDIVVYGVAGDVLKVHNVNGDITVNDARGVTFASTVTGAITVNYTSNPGGASYYTTINGDIKVSYPPGFSADLHFKSMHGEMFTDFSDAELLPATVNKSQTKEGNGTVYKIENRSTIRVGKGGQPFKFETLNGNVYIKKQS